MPRDMYLWNKDLFREGPLNVPTRVIEKSFFGTALKWLVSMRISAFTCSTIHSFFSDEIKMNILQANLQRLKGTKTFKHATKKMWLCLTRLLSYTYPIIIVYTNGSGRNIFWKIKTLRYLLLQYAKSGRW